MACGGQGDLAETLRVAPFAAGLPEPEGRVVIRGVVKKISGECCAS